ncbi:MAG: hypothetical protein GXY85_05595 [Candidatus Brocadiaceae bacterium]|nr:hypothetical protein [Candidatus Brocadiaceae bacterium]
MNAPFRNYWSIEMSESQETTAPSLAGESAAEPDDPHEPEPGPLYRRILRTNRPAVVLP